MNKRMLDKNTMPSFEDMAKYVEGMELLFRSINDWINENYNTTNTIAFPYGNNYGWCVKHQLKKKLICNVFPEKDSFTVMIRLDNKQYQSIYNDVRKKTQEVIDKKYPCSNGGWIHYQVTSEEDYLDIIKIISAKMEKK